MSKHKVVLQARPDHPRQAADRLVSRLTQLDLEDAIAQAGWTDDPGTGKAVILPDGSELLNPLPIAPPVDFREGPSLLEQFEAKMAARFKMLQEDQELDTAEDWEDFEVADDIEPESPYTVVMHDEAPGVPPGQDPSLKPGEKPYPGEEISPDQAAPAVPPGAAKPLKNQGKNPNPKIPISEDNA